MTQTVYDSQLEIVLNLSLDDLGHPEYPGLWDEIKPGKYREGRLVCVACLQIDPGCPESMYTQIRDGGMRVACHRRVGIAEHTAESESPRHLALKERIARTAEEVGYGATLEEPATDGLRRTDVLVHGDDGREIGWEVQLSGITPRGVNKRTAVALRDGITPLWTVENPNAAPINRAPWTRLDRVEDWRLIAKKNTVLNVRGGVSVLRMERCDERRATPCPVNGRGRCGKWHACWDPALGVYLDDMVGRSAAGDLVSFYLPNSSGANGRFMWVTPADRDKFLDGRPEPQAPRPVIDDGGDDTEPHVQQPRPDDPECHWGEETDVRPRRPPRDTGGRIDAGYWLTREDDPGSTPVAASYIPPEDLVDLRIAFLQADAECKTLDDEAPSGLDIARGLAAISDDLRARTAQARAERGRIVEAIHGHSWWSRVANRVEAEAVLRQAADSRG